MWPVLVGGVVVASVLLARGPGETLGAIIFVGIMSAAILSGVAAELRRRGRQRRALRGEVVATRRSQARMRAVFYEHNGHLALGERPTRLVFFAEGLVAERGDVRTGFPWDNVVDAPDGLPSERWALAYWPKTSKEVPAAVVLSWGPGMLDPQHPFTRVTRSHDSVQANGDLSPIDWELCRYLPGLLRDEPRLRVGLDDPVRSRLLVRDISTWDPIFEAQPFGAGGRRAYDVHAAMQQLGFVHRHGRPLPGDVLPALDEVVLRVEAVLRDGHFVDTASHTRQEIIDLIRQDYLDIDPWPFGALLGK